MADWVKLHTDLLDNPDVSEISAEDYRTFTFLIMLARREECADGVLDGWTARRLGYRFRQTEEQITAALESLASVGWITFTPDSVTITNYAPRQYDKPSDQPEATRERQRKHRDNAEGHAPVTPLSRPCHATEKKREEERREEETETKREPSSLPPQPETEADPVVDRLMRYQIPYTQANKLAAGRDALALAWMDYTDAHPAIPNKAAYLTVNIRAGKPPPSNGKGPPGTSPPRVTGLSEADLEWQREHERAKAQGSSKSRAGPAPPA